MIFLLLLKLVVTSIATIIDCLLQLELKGLFTRCHSLSLSNGLFQLVTERRHLVRYCLQIRKDLLHLCYFIVNWMRLSHLLNITRFINFVNCHKKPAWNPIECNFLFDRFRDTQRLCFRQLQSSGALLLNLGLECTFDVHLVQRNLILHL